VELINPVPVEEAEPWVRALATTLLGNPYAENFPRRVARWQRDWPAERAWGYRDAGRWVATLATEARTLTIPGGGDATRDLEVDALTGVTVAATHRRQGLLTSMITQSLQAAKDRGDALSMLIAAEWPIYGRFGYAPAVDDATYVYHSKRPRAALSAPPAGSVRQVEADELGAAARSAFDAARRLRPGQVDRHGSWWDRRLGLDGYELIDDRPNWIVHDGATGIDGLLAWKVASDFYLDGRLGAIEVSDFIAADETAYRDLWAYLSGLDVIDKITLDDRPVDEPVRRLLGDGRALEQTGKFDYLWVRLLDVPAALAARGYATAGRVVLDVIDEGLGGYGAGRVVLDVDETAVRCEPTDEPADLRLTQRALASCYLGGHRLRQVATAGEVDELTCGALERTDVMFAVPLAPWNQTGF
jgi:predicted acetyltransferase